MLRVGVFFGGKNIEREVSFNSGRTVCDHLDSSYFKVIPIFQSAGGDLYLLPWSFLYRGKIADFESRLDAEAETIKWDDLPTIIDFIYIATHGKFAEDGRLQAMLELLQIPYLGTKILGGSIAMNKKLHNDFLDGVVEIPRGFSLSVSEIKSIRERGLEEKIKKSKLSFPLIVKPEGEGSSFGVFVVKRVGDLEKAVRASAFISGSEGQDVLVEQKIEGMEFTCIIITDYKTGELIPLPPTEVILQEGSEIFDYKQKYMPGQALEKTPASSCSKKDLKRVQDECVKVMRALDFKTMARVDGFLDKDGKIIIIDSNPLSGMGPATFLFRQAGEYGMGHSELINCLIKAELKHYKMTRKYKSKKNIDRKKIVVLFGGASEEREISLESGRNVCYKLSSERYETIPVFVDLDMKMYKLTNRLLVNSSTREIQQNLSKAERVLISDLKSIADFVFIGLHGGAGENGTIQGALEMLGIPYNGSSVFASALCNDKYKSANFLKKKGFNAPQGKLVFKVDYKKDKNKLLDSFLGELKFPLIIKPHDDGCSVMVQVAKSKLDLEFALDKIFEKKNSALIEEKISGMEVTVGVIGNKSPKAFLPSESIVSQEILSIEEKFLPGAGENQTPARLPKDDLAFIQGEVERAYKALHCSGYARIDCFFQSAEQSATGKKHVVILEVNTLPGLTPATCLFHQAAENGLRPADLLNKIVELGFKNHKNEEIVIVDDVLKKQKEFNF